MESSSSHGKPAPASDAGGPPSLPPAPLHVLEDILSSSDAPPSHKPEKLHPLDRIASTPLRWLSILFFSFATSLIRLGATRPLQQDDCPPVRKADGMTVLLRRLFDNGGHPRRKFNLLTVFWKTFKHQWANGAFILTINLLGHVFQMVFIRALLMLLNPTAGESPDAFTAGWSGEALAVGLTIAQVYTSLTMNNGMFNRMSMGFNIRALLMSMVYRKTLRIAAHDKHKSTTGQIVTLMSVDAERLYICPVPTTDYKGHSTPKQAR